MAEIEQRAAKELMGEEFTPAMGKTYKFLDEVTDGSQYLISECDDLFTKKNNLRKMRTHSGFENLNKDFIHIRNYFA